MFPNIPTYGNLVVTMRHLIFTSMLVCACSCAQTDVPTSGNPEKPGLPPTPPVIEVPDPPKPKPIPKVEPKPAVQCPVEIESPKRRLLLRKRPLRKHSERRRRGGGRG